MSEKGQKEATGIKGHGIQGTSDSRWMNGKQLVAGRLRTRRWEMRCTLCFAAIGGGGKISVGFLFSSDVLIFCNF